MMDWRIKRLARLARTIDPALCLTLQLARAHVDYNEQIRPIFNEKCKSCHGGVKQAGDVSLYFKCARS